MWSPAGNVARSNRGESAVVAAFLRARFAGHRPPLYVPHPDAGLMMGVLENNEFLAAKKGIQLTPPANWAVIRQNRVTTRAANTPWLAVDGKEWLHAPLILRDTAHAPVAGK